MTVADPISLTHPRAALNRHPCIALLGRPDQPTDALDDFCRFLGCALATRGYDLDLVRMPWMERGWLSALNWLWGESTNWKGRWVLVQYTALGWSRRGFPLLFVVMLRLLRARGVRVAVVFHDPEPFSGTRLIDKGRRALQRWVMRWAYRLADRSITTIPRENVSWLSHNTSKATFIPVGPNIPAVGAQDRPGVDGPEAKTITVFGITGGGTVGSEVTDIAFVAKRASQLMPGVRLVTFGRGSTQAQPRLRQALQGSTVEYTALGVLSAGDAAELLAQSDVSLFVRGGISTQRGSAIASIACGVPLVSYAGPSLAVPLAQAGVVTVPCGDREQLAATMLRVLTDRQLRLDLRRASQQAYKKYFSWDAIAASYAELFDHV